MPAKNSRRHLTSSRINPILPKISVDLNEPDPVGAGLVDQQVARLGRPHIAHDAHARGYRPALKRFGAWVKAR